MGARLGLALLLAAFGLLAWRCMSAQEPGAAPRTESLPVGESPTAARVPVVPREDTDTGARQAAAGEPHFELLPGDPNELVLRLVTGDPKVDVQGAQAWALELDEWGEYRERFDDVEAELRAHGRALACDAQGRVHVPLPGKWILVGARAGELFGARAFESAEAPLGEVELVRSRACRVRTRSVAGGPVAGVPISLCRPDGVIWRSRTDVAGELLIPNVEWLLADYGQRECACFVATEEIAVDPPARRFEPGAEIPREIEFVLGPASTLRLSVVAADGTPLPVGGEVEFYRGGADARRADLRLGRRARPSIALRDGLLLVPRLAPGAWLEAYANLDGGGTASAQVRVPELLGELEIPLRLEPEEQALFVRVVDAQGAPLGGRTLSWQFYAEEPGKHERLGLETDSLHTDESGRGVLVVSREDLLPPDEDPDEQPKPVRLRRGRLVLVEQGTPFESRTIRFEELGGGCVRDLGDLRLERATLIASGRVHDEAGRPLARAEVELQLVRIEHGEEKFDDLPDAAQTRTGADGRFAIFGACPGGTVRAWTSRAGYALPADAKGPDFECGSAPELDVTLLRTGTVRLSVIADRELWECYDWRLEAADHQGLERLFGNEGPGEIVREAELLPGLYRARLCLEDSDAPPIVDVPDVLVRPGERTLDPRVQGVALQLGQGVGRPRAERKPRIALQLVDEWGASVPDGNWISWGGCSWSREEFHGGACSIPPELAGHAIGIWAPGSRFLELDCPERDSRLVLAPAFRARVHFDVPAELRARGVRLFVGLHGPPLEYLDERLWVLELDAQGDALFDCPRPGRCEIDLSAVSVAESGAVGGCQELELDERPGFDVAEQPAEQRFSPAIPAESWAALARALKLAR
jgi:hypothetical protein